MLLPVSKLRLANLGCAAWCKHHRSSYHKDTKLIGVPAARWTLHCAWSRSCSQTGAAWRCWAQA